MVQLTKEDLMWSGGEVTVAVLLGYVAVTAGVAAIIKIITSSRGKISIPGVDIQWGN